MLNENMQVPEDDRKLDALLIMFIKKKNPK